MLLRSNLVICCMLTNHDLKGELKKS